MGHEELDVLRAPMSRVQAVILEKYIGARGRVCDRVWHDTGHSGVGSVSDDLEGRGGTE